MTPDLPPPQPTVELHGDLHAEADSEGAADLRFRLAPEISAAPELTVHGIGDLTTELGSTETTVSWVAAWGEAETPVGVLAVGRMPIPEWGMGMIANPGGCLDCLSDLTVDRVSLNTELARHTIGFALDRGVDDTSTATLTLGRLPTVLARARGIQAGRTVWTYGTWSSLRTRAEDDLSIGMIDGWLRFEQGDLSLETEAVFIRGSILEPVPDVPGVALPALGVQQSGMAVRAGWSGLEFEVGAASGDEADGRGVDGVGQLDPPSDVLWTNLTLSENYTIDRIQWRRGIGAITDAYWVRPSIKVGVGDHLELTGWTTYSAPLVRTDQVLSTELGLRADWELWSGLELRADGAWLVNQATLLEGSIAWVF